MDLEHGKFDWPKEAVLQMINLWQTYECLYNPRNKLYHNKHARYAALNEMAEQLKVFNSAIGATEIKNKMSYLRGQYTREVAKMKERKSGAGAEDVYVPSAYWFSELSFLNDFIKIRKGGCNLNNQNYAQTEESWDLSQYVESEISPAQPSKRARSSIETPQSSRSAHREDSVLTAATNVLQNIAYSSQKTVVNEKDEAFCNYIKTELNALKNMYIKDELMEQITLAVFEAKKKERILNNQDLSFSNFESP